MRYLLTAALLGAATVAAAASSPANPPAPLAQAPVPPPAGMQKDGPFRLLVRARNHAAIRRAQGFRADVVSENGLWWVVYYH